MKTFARIVFSALLTGLLGSFSAAQPTDTAPFEAWHQGFEENTEGWISSEIPGPEGWCGTIEQQSSDSGSVAPSAGEGYAVVQHGECNEYWTNEGWDDSGPYSPGAGFFNAWPTSGYMTELDIYLDAAASTTFTHVVSIRLLDIEDFEESLRYFLMSVTMDEGRLLVAGNEVAEAGWYTFRHAFGSEGANLTVTFELVRNGETLFVEPMMETAFTEEETSSFEVTNVGTGYIWFTSIANGLELAIDEHRVRRGE